VERALARVPGVTRVYVNPATEKAYIEAEPALTDRQRLIAAVKTVGLRAGEVVER
jgi:Cu+-exporting ATPase